MLVNARRIHDVKASLPLLEALTDEGQQEFVLFLLRAEECAEMAMAGESLIAEVERLGRHVRHISNWRGPARTHRALVAKCRALRTQKYSVGSSADRRW